MLSEDMETPCCVFRPEILRMQAKMAIAGSAEYDQGHDLLAVRLVSN